MKQKPVLTLSFHKRDYEELKGIITLLEAKDAESNLLGYKSLLTNKVYRNINPSRVCSSLTNDPISYYTRRYGHYVIKNPGDAFFDPYKKSLCNQLKNILAKELYYRFEVKINLIVK